MAAPITQQFTSKQMIKCVMSGNIVKATTCILLFTLPLESKSFLSLVNQHSIALKINIISISLLEIFSRLINPDKIDLKLTDWIKSILLMIISCLMFAYTAMLFGAPFVQHTSETFHFATLLTATTILPCCLSLGANVINWVNVFSLNRVELGSPMVSYITCIMSLLGTWLGAFPIPLDWDRPWQVWPISCVIGNLVGYSCGLIISTIYVLYSYRQQNKFKLT